MKKSTTCTAEGFGVTSSNCVTPSAVLYPTNDTRMKSAGHSRRGPYAPRLGKLSLAAMERYERDYEVLVYCGGKAIPPKKLPKELSSWCFGSGDDENFKPDDEELAKLIDEEAAKIEECIPDTEYLLVTLKMRLAEKEKKEAESFKRRSQGRKRATKKSDAQQLEEREFVKAIEHEIEKRKKTGEKERAMWERLAPRFNCHSGASLKGKYYNLRNYYGL